MRKFCVVGAGFVFGFTPGVGVGVAVNGWSINTTEVEEQDTVLEY